MRSLFLLIFLRIGLVVNIKKAFSYFARPTRRTRDEEAGGPFKKFNLKVLED